MIQDRLNFEAWAEEVPDTIRRDALWKMRVYRMALWLSDLTWTDVTVLAREPRTRSLADQLYRAVGSISANVAEGYSRGTGRDRARFLEYALGSARESRDWYYKARHVLGTAETEHRLFCCTDIIRLLLTTIPSERGTQMREPEVSYDL